MREATHDGYGARLHGLLALVVWLCGAVFAAGAGASPDLPELAGDAGLREYLAYAGLNSASLEAAFDRWKAALEAIPQATSLPAPRFTYGYFIQEVETRVGPQQQRFGVSQMFPWFGTLRARGDAAAEQAAAMQQLYEQRKLDLFYRVAAAYHESWYLGEALAVTREHVKLVGNLEGVASTRLKVGAAPHSALMQAQVEQGKLDDRLRSMEALQAPLAAQLNAALNRPVWEPVPWPTSVPDVHADFTDAQAAQWLAQDNPELRSIDHLIRKEEVGERLAVRRGCPRFSVGVDLIQTGDALDPAMTDSGKDPLIAMVTVDLPVWRGSSRAAVREAQLRKAATESDREERGRRLAADLQVALFKLHDADRKLGLYRDTLIPKAAQSLGVAQKGFESGSTSFSALIDAQRLLLEFQLAQRRACADRGIHFAEVGMLTGRAVWAGDLNEEKQDK